MYSNSERNFHWVYDLLWFYSFVLVVIRRNMHSKCCSSRWIHIVWPGCVPLHCFRRATSNTRASRNSKPCGVLSKPRGGLWIKQSQMMNLSKLCCITICFYFSLKVMFELLRFTPFYKVFENKQIWLMMLPVGRTFQRSFYNNMPLWWLEYCGGRC